MESKILRKLYNIDNILENILMEILDEDIQSSSNDIYYILISIENLTKRIQTALKEE